MNLELGRRDQVIGKEGDVVMDEIFGMFSVRPRPKLEDASHIYKRLSRAVQGK